MPRCRWSDLPAEVQATALAHAGAFSSVDSVADGEHCDIAAVLRAPNGHVFVKGMRTDPDSADLRSLRAEAKISPYVTQYAPPALVGDRGRGVAADRV